MDPPIWPVTGKNHEKSDQPVEFDSHWRAEELSLPTCMQSPVVLSSASSLLRAGLIPTNVAG